MTWFVALQKSTERWAFSFLRPMLRALGEVGSLLYQSVPNRTPGRLAVVVPRREQELQAEELQARRRLHVGGFIHHNHGTIR